jgi:hypothetical protein
MNDGMMHNRISIMKIWDVTLQLPPLNAVLPSFFSVVLLLSSLPRLDDVGLESGCC